MTRKSKEPKTLLYEEMKELRRFGLLRRLRRTHTWHHLILRQPWEASAVCTSERRKDKELAHPQAGVCLDRKSVV